MAVRVKVRERGTERDTFAFRGQRDAKAPQLIFDRSLIAF